MLPLLFGYPNLVSLLASVQGSSSKLLQNSIASSVEAVESTWSGRYHWPEFPSLFTEERGKRWNSDTQVICASDPITGGDESAWLCAMNTADWPRRQKPSIERSRNDVGFAVAIHFFTKLIDMSVFFRKRLWCRRSLPGCCGVSWGGGRLGSEHSFEMGLFQTKV